MTCNKTNCIANINCNCCVNKCKGEITSNKHQNHQNKEKAKITYKTIAKIFEKEFSNDES